MSVIKFLPLDLGSALLAGIFQVLFERLIPHNLPHLIVPENEVLAELKKWFAKLEIFQAALDDAEEKQWKNMAVKMWVDDVRDFAYDLEDMLDAHNTGILKRSFNEKSQKNLLSIIIEELKNLLDNFNKMSKSRAMTQRLDQLCERRSLLGLIENTAGGTSTAVWQRPPSTCLPTEPAIYGRDQDKTIILEMMSRDQPSAANFRVISIVGMAGVGKTTLAKEVYNDSIGVTDFNLQVWICVSNDFDVFRISKAILESITHSTCDLKDLNEVQVQLKYAVAGRRFLLVLDDVWSKNYDSWVTLKSPFVTGARGSRIIVTTRCIDVALTMGGPCDYYNLKLLSDDHCWSVFQMHAFESRNIDAYPNLESVREKVVQKCGGLPLAARTLGGLLRSKQTNDEWENILSSRIWDLPEDNSVLPVLKLSYYHLPSHLKRCFAYCAILPKNYEFEEKELVHLWMAEGLIIASTNNKQLEDLGSEYFHNLLSRSIFQQSSGDASKFVMHSLFNDLAQWVSGETSFMLDNEAGANKQFKGFQRVRHSSYTVGQYDGKSKFDVFDEVIDHLRTFLPILTHNLDCYISDAVIFNQLPKFKRLRVLSLQKYHITKLPDSIGELRYLRYLNLADTKIASLPDSVTDLFNLQILILRNCSLLSELPPKLGTLINLRHLDIQGMMSLCHMPLEMQALQYLQTLSDFVVGKNCGSPLKDLKNLKFLRGQLHISKLENVADSQELTGAILSDKKKLEVLILEWGPVNNSRNKDNEKDVLHMLQPHTNLKNLTIKCYGGSVFPSWIEDSAFSNMVALRLEGCANCTSLPSLGVLGNLKELTMIRMTQLTTIDSGFYGSCSKPFQSLEMLRLEDLQEWSRWEPIGDNVDDNVFGHLRELSIVKCPKLSERLPAHLPSLQKIVIQKCAELVVSIPSVPMLCEIEIDECRKMVYTIGADSLSLNSVSLSNITEFKNWFSQAFRRVETLIIKFPLLDSIPERPFLSSLISLEIKDCSALTSLQEVMEQSACLDRLLIEGCDSLTSVAKGQLPSSLKRLEIRSCRDLRCLLDARDQDGSHISASLLEYLYVAQCPSLKSLSSRGQLPESLQHLEIHNCSKLTALGQLPETLKRIEIKTCRNLNSLFSSGQLLASLEYLSIKECPITTLSLTVRFPASLQHLNIESCSQLESLSSVQLPAPLKYLKINDCTSLSSIADNLQNLSSLREIHIFKCPSLKNFPQNRLPKSNLTILSIPNCENFVALPSSMHTLNSLQELHIFNLKSLSSFLEQGFPINLTSLSITSPQFYDQVMDRLHKLTSLRKLRISGCQDAKCFPQEKKKKKIGLPTYLTSKEKKKAILLPTSLTSLTLDRFGKLGSLSPKGFRNLTSLECLSISKCPALTSFPKEGLPSSLLELHISNCSSLKDYCMRDIKRDQSKLANIPYVAVDGKNIRH